MLRYNSTGLVVPGPVLNGISGQAHGPSIRWSSRQVSLYTTTSLVDVCSAFTQAHTYTYSTCSHKELTYKSCVLPEV